jgi:hypothetical protein
MIKNIIFAGVIEAGEFKFDNPAFIDVRFNASRLVITKICSISNLQVDEDLPEDPPAIFSLHMSNTVDPIGEIVVDRSSRSDICNDVIWMPNMISGAISFHIKGASFNIFTDSLLIPIEVLGPNTLLSLTVHMHFEE